MHAAGYGAAGRDDFAYDLTDVTAAGLEDHLAGLDSSWVGLSLTMPLKQRALQLVRKSGGAIDDVAEATGSVNTLVFTRRDDRARPVPSAFNTDVAGIIGAFADAGITAVDGRCAVIGGGATAASAAAAFARMGAGEIAVFARTPGRAAGVKRTAALLGTRAVVRPLAEWRPDEYRTVVNTTPIGASTSVADLVGSGVGSGVGSVAGSVAGTLLDVVYDPWPTPLAESWANAGGAVIDGAAMLAHQAVGQIELFLAEADARADARAGGRAGGRAERSTSGRLDPVRRAAITDAVLAVVRERGD